MKQSDIYICKRLQLLKFLKDKGFEPFIAMPSTGKPGYTDWAFDASKEGFKEALDNYFKAFK